MKILQINSVCGIGSTGRIAVDIHNLLMEQHFESYIAYGRGKPLHCNNVIRIGNNFDNYIHVLKTRIFDQHGCGSKRATNEFIKEVIKLDPDIIHLHNIHGYYINIEILFNFLKEFNKPVVWTFHDCWSFTGHCAYFDYIGCEKWKYGCNNCPQKRVYPRSNILDNSYNNYFKKKELFNGVNKLMIVTPSLWLANIVQKSFLNKYPVKVINNGIDLNIFRPVKCKFREKYNLNNKFVILGVANVWDQRKGLHFFVELANKISENDIIILVGLNETKLKNLPKNIICIPRTDNVEELVEIYSSADVFVNPSLEDNFPTTNLEALACGTPVITFNTGGSPECINNNCGYIVIKEDIEGLHNSIELIKNKGKIFYYENAINRAHELFDKKRCFQKYINLYNVLLEKV